MTVSRAVFAGVVSGAAAITVALAVSIAGSGGGGGGGTANFWVDTNGGTCARSATPAAYVDATACATLNAAYQAASLGDSVLIKAGAYDAQTIDDEPTKDTTGLAADVVFDEAAGESASFPSITLGTGLQTNTGPDHLTIKNVELTGDSSLTIWGDETWDVTFDAVDMKSFYMNGVQDVTIKNSDIGPLTISSPVGPGNSKIDGGTPANNNVTIGPGNVFHEYVFGSTCIAYGGANDCHGEALIIFGGTNINVKGNWFWKNETYDVMLQPIGAGTPSITIENNWFGRTQNAGGTCCGNGAQRGTAVCLCFNNPTGVLVRGNSFASGESLVFENTGTATNVRATGNIFGVSASCISGVTYTYNTWTGGTPCTGTGNTTMAVLPYVNTSDVGAGNYHLTGAETTAADNAWTPTTGDDALTDDYDLQSRPQDATKDIGSDDR